jgi:hypothetical protein
MLLKEFDEGEMISEETKVKKKSILKRLKERCCSKRYPQSSLETEE